MRRLLVLAFAACSPAPYTIDAAAYDSGYSGNCAMQFTGGGFGAYACDVNAQPTSIAVMARGFPGASGYPGSARLRVAWNGPPTERTYGSTDPDVQGGAVVVLGEGASMMTWIATTYELTLTSLMPVGGSFAATLPPSAGSGYTISFTGTF